MREAPQPAAANIPQPVWLILVSFGGFANLATEIIGPRMFASIFGNATAIWAVIISVTLLGLSAGYTLGGRLTLAQVHRRLPTLLTINAVWLLLLSWWVWLVPPAVAQIGLALDGVMIAIIAFGAFFVPSVLFGMLSPMAITSLSSAPAAQAGKVAGNVYALSTVGSVLGALTAAYFWIPFVGLSLSLRIFAGGLLAFAVWLSFGRRRAQTGALLVAALLFPLPRWEWQNVDGLTLVAQREGYYQTIRVYTDAENTFMQMHLGPTFQSRLDLASKEPTFNYALTLLDLIARQQPNLNGQRALIIGGAGHALAHGLENRGALVTEVELDPLVIALSDRYFGAINGTVIQADGRAFVETAALASYDLMILDAFDSGTGVPPQLTTREFYARAQALLTPDGVFMMNFVGSPTGRNSDAYRAVATTLASAFPNSGAQHTRDDPAERQNILLVGSNAPLAILGLNVLPTDGVLLTDDRNPIEVLFERARDRFYYRR
jgi:spermidine synthase